MSIFKRILKEVKYVYSTYLEVNDQLLSSELKEILDDKESRTAYFKAIDSLKNNKEEDVEIELKKDRKITISLTH